MIFNENIISEIEKYKRSSKRWKEDKITSFEACLFFLSRYGGITPSMLIEDYSPDKIGDKFILDVWENYLHEEPDPNVINNIKIFISMNNMMLGINENLSKRKTHILLMVYLLRDTVLSILADSFVPPKNTALGSWLKRSYLSNSKESFLCTQQLVREHIRSLNLIRELFHKLTQETYLPFSLINIGEEEYMNVQANNYEELRTQALNVLPKEVKKSDHCMYILRPILPSKTIKKEVSKLERKIERYRVKISEKKNVIYDGRESLSEIDSFLRVNDLYE